MFQQSYGSNLEAVGPKKRLVFGQYLLSKCQIPNVSTLDLAPTAVLGIVLRKFTLIKHHLLRILQPK